MSPDNKERRPLERTALATPTGVEMSIARNPHGAPSVRRNQPSKVYRLRQDISGRTLVQPNRNASRALIEQHLPDLPQDMIEQFQALCAQEDRTISSIRLWADAFIDAYYDGRPLPSLGNKHRFAAKGDFKDMGSREAALHAVLDNRSTGVTAAEARRHTGIGGSAIGGGLSMLDQAGVLARIEGDVR